MIKPHEFKYERKYSGTTFFGKKTMLSHKEQLARLIDTDWHYSWHWPEDHDKCLDAIKRDLAAEMVSALDRVEELKQAKRILDATERVAV